MGDEQKNNDRYLRASRTLVVGVHLAILAMSSAVVYFEIVNIMNMSKLGMGKGWWTASIVSLVCQAIIIGCATFAIVSIFLDFEKLSGWFGIIPVTGISIALAASLTLAIPTLGYNFPSKYASQLFEQYSGDGQFWANLKAFEESNRCCGINGVGDYALVGGDGRATGQCALSLRLIQFDFLDEGFLRPIKWDFDMAFNTSNYHKSISMNSIGAEAAEALAKGRRECQAAAFKFKEKLEDWSRKLVPQLEARMGLGMNIFAATSSCGQLLAKLAADSRRLFMFTAAAWLLTTLACLGAFLYGRLKHAVIQQQVVQQVVQQVQPAAPAYAPPAPYMLTPRSSFGSLDGYDMFSAHQPSYYRHPAQNVAYYNPQANYPRDVSLRPAAAAPLIRP